MAPAPPSKPSGDKPDENSSAIVPTNPGTAAADGRLAFDVEIGSYAELDRVCQRISEEIAPLLNIEGGVHVFYLDNALREALDLRPLVETQLRNLQESYRGVADAARQGLAGYGQPADLPAPRVRLMEVFPALAAAPAVIDSAVDLLGMLREDVRYTGRPATISPPAFALALARHIQKHNRVRFHYPTLFLPLGAGDPKVLQELIRGMDTVIEQRKLASTQIERLAARLIPGKSDDASFADAKSALDAARDAFQAAEAVREDYQANMTKADEQTGLSRVQLLERSGYVGRIVTESPQSCYFLFAQVVASGGAYRTTSGLVAGLTGHKLRHSAGVVVTFAMFLRDGTLVTSRTLGSRSPYKSSDEEIEF